MAFATSAAKMRIGGTITDEQQIRIGRSSYLQALQRYRRSSQKLLMLRSRAARLTFQSEQMVILGHWAQNRVGLNQLHLGCEELVRVVRSSGPCGVVADNLRGRLTIHVNCRRGLIDRL